MTRRLTAALAVVTALSLLAAACGNSGDDKTDTTPTTPAGTDAPSESTPPDSSGTSTPTDGVDRSTFVPISGVPGVSDDAITVGVLGLRTSSPLGTCILDCYLTGVQAYFDYQNSSRGSSVGS
ncbi:MAG: hypothetical protein R2695_19580 [Acidimicrobiales bacterium]